MSQVNKNIENQEVKAKKPPVKKPKKKKKIDGAMIAIIVGLIIIATPFLVLGYMLISASMATGSVLAGDRFEGDLDPAITQEQIAAIEQAVSSKSGVESVEIQLKTATLRLYVDTSDSYSVEQAEALAQEAYNAITSELDVATYFTRTQEKNMYDIEVHVYNLSENRDSEAFSYVIISKSSSISEKVVDVVSEPKDPELAQQILDELEAKRNPTPTPDSNEESAGGLEEELLEDEVTTEGEE